MTPINASVILDPGLPGLLPRALAHLPGRALVLDEGLWPEAGLTAAPLDAEEAFVRLRALLQPAPAVLVVQMGWLFAAQQGVTGIEHWGAVADRIATELGLAVVSVYDRETVIEEQMQAAFRAHRQFLAPSGLHDNPWWIPPQLMESASLEDQLSFLLGRVVPDYAGLTRPQAGQMFARGATPSWMGPRKPGLGTPPGPGRWHIHCLGQLRVFVAGVAVDWHLSGSAPKKTRTLFAYLLQSGEKGAHADQIGELLWPEGASEDLKRTRLHHTVAMLRKTLGVPDAVLRNGEYYRLNPPPGSWIDIDTFEQLCRRGLSLFKRGEIAAALRVYAAADQLYGGDLFEDLPLEYVRSETDDWCMPRRIWLREMAVKLQYDFAKVCMKSDRTREALEHCQKALAIDPTSEGANAEAMRIFVAQGRHDAMHRQYRQYRAALEAIGATEGVEIRTLYRDLAKAV